MQLLAPPRLTLEAKARMSSFAESRHLSFSMSTLTQSGHLEPRMSSLDKSRCSDRRRRQPKCLL